MEIIAVLAKKLSENCENSNEYDKSFIHDKKHYTKLIDFDEKRLFRDVKNIPDLQIHETSNHWDEQVVYLSLFLLEQSSSGFVATTHPRQFERRYRVLQQFFSFAGQNQEAQNNQDAIKSVDESDTSSLNLESSLRELFFRLKETHKQHQDSIEQKPVQHSSLYPELRQYQMNAVRWMIHRELVADYFPGEFIRVESIYEKESFFFLNPRTLEVCKNDPGPIAIPSGGILADEMGLGKTVEFLALLLHNKNPNLANDEPLRVKKRIRLGDKSKILCICGNLRIKGKEMIRCKVCSTKQHRICVLRNSIDEDSDYICPNCWKNQDEVKSSTTIIISPVAIKEQWYSEITRHVNVENFKVLIYNGISVTGWTCPRDLAKYDVVLTDYNTLRSEIYFTNREERSDLRHESKFMFPDSPLMKVKWWRVCLDEAQMVETPNNQCSRMARQIPAVHRWSVTGTPIEKKIENLYGQLIFLDLYPMTDTSEFEKVMSKYRSGDMNPLVEILSKIMWRTCKADVLDQINIPPQTVVTHLISMSDLESFFYMSQHEKFSQAFNNKAIKIKNSLSVSSIDPSTLKSLMEPLGKIRLDCTAPSVLLKNSVNSSIHSKKILRSDALLSHLLSQNEMEGKQQLRSINASLNGLAAISIIRNDYRGAVKLYKVIMKRAKEQKECNITVDTLQQIHAVFNLTKIIDDHQIVDDEVSDQLPELRTSVDAMEWKYINTYYALVKQHQEQLDITQTTIKLIQKKIPKFDGNWWREILYEIQGTSIESQLIARLKFEIADPNVVDDEISSVRGLDYTIWTWWSELLTSRSLLVKSFQDLDFFIRNIRPPNEINDDLSKKIESLMKSVFDCHLQLEEKKVSSSRKSKPPKKLCEICKTKKVLQSYECNLFKKIYRDEMDTGGTWNPKYQEVLLKTVYNFCKNRSEDSRVISEADVHMDLLENFKKEYKEFSKLWVEVNYTASAYDELNMCKSRIEARDPFLMTVEDKKNPLIISTYDIDDTNDELQSQLQEGEREFLKYLGRIKYLKHLEEKKEVQICPICQIKQEEKYTLLQCGHIMCLICVNQMESYQPTHLTCCVCRNRQSYKDIFYARSNKLEKEENVTTVEGDFSSKIIEIVLTILKLLAEDPHVKIVIFSQFDIILSIISSALSENGISFCKISQKIQKCVSEFKDLSLKKTCLLMLLKSGSKGLNLIEATHVFLVEPILNPGEELQAIGRVHRIGQTKPTFVHKFIVRDTIEEKIYHTISNDNDGKWRAKAVTIQNLQDLFKLESAVCK